MDQFKKDWQEGHKTMMKMLGVTGEKNPINIFFFLGISSLLLLFWNTILAFSLFGIFGFLGMMKSKK